MAVSPRASRFLLAALLLLVALARLRTYHEPLERDLATYAVLGHELLGGRPLYSDLWDHKPPAIHLTYALGERLAGYGAPAVYLLNVAAAGLALAGVHAAARAAGATPAGALWAAAFFAVLSGDLPLQANQPNVEAFLDALLVWALALLLGCRAGARRGPRVAAAAVLLALAVLYKPNALAFAGALAAAHCFFPPPADGGRRRALAEAAAMLATVAGFALATAGWFAASGHLEELVKAVLTYNRAYGGNLARNLARGLLPGHLLPRAAIDTAPLALLALHGLARRDPRRKARSAGLLLAYAAASFVAVASPGRFFPHYYQIWLPLLAVAGGWLSDALARREPAVALALLVLLQLRWYALDADQWSLRKYGPLYVEAAGAGRLADRLLPPGATLWSGEPGVTYASGRPAPSGVVYDLPLAEGPLAGELTARVLADLTRRPPELIVLGNEPGLPAGHALARWVDSAYDLLPADPAFPRFRFYRRRT